jgi:multiple sugar transport system substrate-binding protein
MRATAAAPDGVVTRRSALRLAAWLGAAGGLASVAGACGSAGGQNVPPAATVGPSSIRFTYWGADPEEVGIEDRIIAAFNQHYPQIKVENGGDSAGTAPYHEKLIAQAAAGTWADVGRIQSVDMARFAKGGFLAPLDDWIKRDHYSLDDFWPAALPMSAFQKKLYTLPVIGGPNPLFWNVRAFREAGVAPATEQDAKGTWTWDAMVDAARRTTKRDGDAFRVGGYNVDLTWGGVSSYLWSAGGDYYNAQLTKCTIADPPAIEAVQYMVDLIQRHHVWPAPSENAAALKWPPPTATVAMQISAITGSWQWRQDPTFEFDVVNNPKGKAGQIGRLNANGYGIFTGSKAQPAAWLFLQHLAGVDTLKLLASLGRSFPWRKTIAQSKEYRDQQPIKSVDVVLKLAEKGKSWPIVTSWNDTERAANPIFKDMGDGKIGVREGLERIRAEADRLLTG